MTRVTFHKLAREFWTSTSIKGVPRAIKSVSPLTRAFWGITTVCCLTMLLWQASTLLLKYYKYLVAINAYDANETPHFPNVMVCNTYPYDFLSKFHPTYNEYTQYIAGIRQQIALTPSATFAQGSQMWSDVSSRNGYLSTQQSFPGTPPLPPNSNFITDCSWFTWNWGIYNSGNGTDCFNAMQVVWNPNYYQCYIYKPPITGLMGFSSIVYIDNFATTIFKSTKMSLGKTVVNGIRVYVFPNDTYPLVYFEGINVSAGKEVTLKIEETDVTHLAEPYGACTNQKRLDPNDPDSPTYTQSACMTICRQQQYVELCSCLVVYEAFLPKQQEAVDYRFCAGKLMNSNESDVLKLAQYPMCDYFLWGDNSLCDCPAPCTETDYALSMSIADWPNPANQIAFYDKYIKPNPQIYGNKFDAYGALESRSGNMTAGEIVDEINQINLIPHNFIQLNVRIMTQNYRKNDDLPAVGWETLFSNLGGTLNLWMGITVLFAAEFAEFVVAVLTMYFTKVIHHEVDNVGEMEVDDIEEHSEDLQSNIFPDYSHPEEEEADGHSKSHRFSIYSSTSGSENKHKKHKRVSVVSGHDSVTGEKHKVHHRPSFNTTADGIHVRRSSISIKSVDSAKGVNMDHSIPY